MAGFGVADFAVSIFAGFEMPVFDGFGIVVFETPVFAGLGMEVFEIPVFAGLLAIPGRVAVGAVFGLEIGLAFDSTGFGAVLAVTGRAEVGLEPKAVGLAAPVFSIRIRLDFVGLIAIFGLAIPVFSSGLGFGAVLAGFGPSVAGFAENRFAAIFCDGLAEVGREGAGRRDLESAVLAVVGFDNLAGGFFEAVGFLAFLAEAEVVGRM